MSRVSGVIQCVLNSDMPETDKQRLVREINNVGYDSAEGKLVFSDADVAKKLDEKLERELLEKQKQLYQQAVQLDRAFQNERLIKQVFDELGPEGLERWFNDLLTQDLTGDVARTGVRSIDAAGAVIHNELTRDLGKVAARFGERIMGMVARPEQQKQWVMAIMRQDFSDPDVGELARAAFDAIEKARLMYNDAGGVLPKRAGYVFPTKHSPDAMINEFGGKDGWIAYMEQNFDVYNPATNQPFSGSELRQALNIIYDNVTTGRPDAPMVNFRVTQADGSVKDISASVLDEKVEALTSLLQKEVDDAKAADLDMKIGKAEADKQRLKEAGKSTDAAADRLAKLREDRASIISEEQYAKANKELGALKKAEPQSIGGEKLGDMPLSKLRAQERAMVPKSPEAWFEYQQRSGVEDFMGAMVGNLEQMANEIALMKQFGPDAERGFRFMVDNIKHRAPDRVERKSKLRRRLSSTGEKWAGYYRVLSGQVNGGGDYKAARAAGILRNVATGSRLAGSTFTVAIGDLHTGWNAAGLAGTGRLKTLFNQTASLFKGRNAHTANMGLGISHMVSSLTAINRYSEVAEVSGKTAKYADIMTRLNGMQHLTRAADQVLPLRINSMIAENLARGWDDIPAQFRRNTLERYGITADDWADMQKAMGALSYLDREGLSTSKRGGSALYLDLSALDQYLPVERATEIRQKIMYAQETYRKLAVMKSTVQARWATSGFGRSQDDWGGVAGRLLTQFMSFPISYLNTHIELAIRMMKEPGQSYGLQLFMTSLIAGGLIVQIDEMRKGRDPRNMVDKKNPWNSAQFMGEAVARGGGLGFYADMAMALAGGEEGAGQKFLGPGLGVFAGLTGSAWKATVTAAGEEQDPLKALARLTMEVTDLSPTRNHIATALAHQAFVDYIASMMDPQYVRETQRRSERYYQRERDSTFWWRRTQPDEVRPPNLGAAIGEDR